MFDSLDADKSGFLDESEVKTLLSTYEVPLDTAQSIIDQFLLDDKKIKFDHFYQILWKLRVFTDEKVILSANISDKMKCQAVFDSIDVNKEGSISATAIKLILDEWGCPTSDVDEYLKRYDTDGNGMFDFDEFYVNMKEMWSFGFENLSLRQHTHATENVDLLQHESFKASKNKPKLN